MILARLRAITRCMEILEECQHGLWNAKTPIDSLNWLHGQMDWLEELNRLLYN